MASDDSDDSDRKRGRWTASQIAAARAKKQKRSREYWRRRRQQLKARRSLIRMIALQQVTQRMTALPVPADYVPGSLACALPPGPLPPPPPDYVPGSLACAFSRGLLGRLALIAKADPQKRQPVEHDAMGLAVGARN